jgi:hypothetical protein
MKLGAQVSVSVACIFPQFYLHKCLKLYLHKCLKRLVPNFIVLLRMMPCSWGECRVELTCYGPKAVPSRKLPFRPRLGCRHNDG